VACFYELEDRLIIHPDECIDCSACESECPVEAIYADSDIPRQYQSDIEFNTVEAKHIKEAAYQAAVVQKRQPLATATQRKDELGY